jgi:hypothetical protein
LDTLPVTVYPYTMGFVVRWTIAVLVILVTGCASTGTYTTGGSPDDPQYIYKIERKIVTTDGVQSMESEVVKVPYTP